MTEITFDGDNSYPNCEGCGHCCEINIICCSAEELAIMQAYIAENNVTPIDYHKERCCFQREDHSCMIWTARPQICRLHNCHVPRWKILELNPSITVDYDKPLIDLHDTFVLQ